MVALLVVLTVVEILLLVVVLAVYLGRVLRGLRRAANLFSRISFGVRAIERQLGHAGPDLERLNAGLATIGGRLRAPADERKA